MAPAQVANPAFPLSPDRGGHRGLPLLKRLGFKKHIGGAHSPTRTKHPEKWTSQEQIASSDSSMNSEASQSSETAASSGSDASKECDNRVQESQSTLHSYDTCTKVAASGEQLISFLSRVKYVSDDNDVSEATSMSLPPGASYADQRLLIQARAAKVRNQLELKFRIMAFANDMEVIENDVRLQNRQRYDPLQTIRDRKLRPKLGRHVHRINMWQIPIAEEIQDMRWRYQSLRMRAQKIRRKSKKIDAAAQWSVSSEAVAAAATVDPQATPQQAAREDYERFSSPASQHDSWEGTPARPTFTNPFRQPSIGTAEGPTCNLPDNRLIDRLKSSHGDEEAAPNNGSSSGSDTHEHLVLPDGSIGVDPLDQMSTTSKSKALFCRNSANVAGTLNRLHRKPSNEPNTGDSELLRPLSLVPSRNSSSTSRSTTSVQSRLSWHDDPQSGFADSRHGSSGGDISAANSTLNLDTPEPAAVPSAPVLTVTSDAGKERVLEPGLHRNGKSSSFGSTSTLLRPPAPSRLASSLSQRNGSVSSGLSVSMADDVKGNTEDPGSIRAFGSIRATFSEGRRAPWERNALNAEVELEYLVAFYSIALRHVDPKEICSRVGDSAPFDKRTELPILELKNERVPKFLKYLSSIEQSVVNEQQALDSGIATALDALRVTTDRLVSEVNTTLNKQIRETSSRMERMYTCKNGSWVCHPGYNILEYAVLVAMWVIWSVVKLWKVIYACFNFTRAACSICFGA